MLWVQVETSRVGITDAVPASLLLLVDVEKKKKKKKKNVEKTNFEANPRDYKGL